MVNKFNHSEDCAIEWRLWDKMQAEIDLMPKVAAERRGLWNCHHQSVVAIPEPPVLAATYGINP